MSLQSCGIACRFFSLTARSPLTSRLHGQSGLVVAHLPASTFRPSRWGPSGTARPFATTPPRQATNSTISTIIQKLRNEVDTAQAQNRRLAAKLEQSDAERRIAQMRYEKMSERLTENNKTMERWQQRNAETKRNLEKAKHDFERKFENNLKSYLKLVESKDAQIREFEEMKHSAWVVAALIKVVGGTICIGIILRFILFAGLVIEEDLRKARMENKNV
ncbi:hypothetical protein N0V92_009649 [Colletotrichum tropicale]|nr:hypothetical protein N0V92_009649 [Colletotrichum tropicale]